MLFAFIFLFILILIIFFPIPIKISMKYIDNNFSMFLWNKDFSSKLKKSIDIQKASKKPKEKPSSKKKSKEKLFDHIKDNMSLREITDLVFEFLNMYTNTSFKPKLNFKVKYSYGFEDAAITALFYGFLSMAFSFIYNILHMFFNFKSFNFDVNPIFEKSKSNFILESIIYISLANIIYTGFIFLKLFFKYKRKTHYDLGGINYGKTSN